MSSEPRKPNAIHVEVTDRQLAMIQHPATVLWIGTGTKTGKTTGFALWLADGLLAGEPCAWSGKQKAKTREAYDLTKQILSYAIETGEVTYNDTEKRLESRTGGLWDPYSGENPEAIFGSGYKRFVIDEASRQPEMTFTAALTTVSSTHGQIRLAFNLEKGSKNWAIRNLLRVRNMSDAERARQSEDYMIFPTADAPFVDPAFIELMRRKMPPAMFEALYNAQIPESDVSLFRNLDKVFTGKLRYDGPLAHRSYIQAVDLARKQDWTVAIVGDAVSGELVDIERFHEIPWNLQYERVAAQYKKFRCGASFVDATGLGDPVVEELEKRGMVVEGVVIVPGSRSDRARRSLIEGSVVACDNAELHAPALDVDPRWRPLYEEMESFEYVLDDFGNVSYGAPQAMNDDCVMALSLYVRALKTGRFGLPRYEPGDPRLSKKSMGGFG